jgi:hypothetical protein
MNVSWVGRPTFKHTVEHLFLHCKALDAERAEIRSQMGHLDLFALLRTDAKTAMRWAILHFGLSQFETAKEIMLENEAWVKEQQAAEAAKQAERAKGSGSGSGSGGSNNAQETHQATRGCRGGKGKGQTRTATT